MNDRGPRLCFLLLVHDQPRRFARLARQLLSEGDDLVCHLDAKTPDTFFTELRDALGSDYDRILWADRVQVEWGEWSIVQATLNGLAAIEAAGLAPDHVCLLSGADYPIRPLGQLRAFLGRHPDVEFIDCNDAEGERWIVDGLQEERYQYRFWLNWRKHPWWFSRLFDFQRRFLKPRRLPQGLKPFIGAQWWTLTGTTCRAVLERSRDPELTRFFRSTWIPDEMYFQTLVAALVDDPSRLSGRTLTHYLFTGQGVPFVFCTGHDAYLSKQPFFFARKLSPQAPALIDALDETLARGDQPPPKDEEVGVDAGHYAAWLARAEQADARRWRWGRAGEEPLGVLAFNERRYTVILASDAADLDAALALAQAEGSEGWHGRLFDPERIRWAGDAQRLQGYRPEDTAIRDQDRAAFWLDLLRLDGASRGFAWLAPEDTLPSRPEDEADGPLPSFFWLDPNATVLRLTRGEAADLEGRPDPAERCCREIEIPWGRDDSEALFREALADSQVSSR